MIGMTAVLDFGTQLAVSTNRHSSWWAIRRSGVTTSSRRQPRSSAAGRGCPGGGVGGCRSGASAPAHGSGVGLPRGGCLVRGGGTCGIASGGDVVVMNAETRAQVAERLAIIEARLDRMNERLRVLEGSRQLAGGSA